MGNKIYHQGTVNKKFEENSQPDGWELGMYLSDRSRNKLRNKMLGDDNPMKNPDVAKKVGDKQRGELSLMWGKTTSDKQKEMAKQRMSISNPMKNPSISNTVHSQLKGRDPWNKNLTAQTDLRVKRYSQNSLQKRKQFYSTHKGDANYYNKIVAKRLSTMKQNGTMYSSKQEDRVYDKLLSIFSVDDIVRQYCSDRYPFACDFYIKSLDLFIECNFHFTHGIQRYLGNEDDLLKVEELKNLSNTLPHPNLYDAQIDVWTRRDVIKYQYAEQQKLNYMVFYTEQKFNDWLSTMR